MCVLLIFNLRVRLLVNPRESKELEEVWQWQAASPAGTKEEPEAASKPFIIYCIIPHHRKIKGNGWPSRDDSGTHCLPPLNTQYDQ